MRGADRSGTNPRHGPPAQVAPVSDGANADASAWRSHVGDDRRDARRHENASGTALPRPNQNQATDSRERTNGVHPRQWSQARSRAKRSRQPDAGPDCSSGNRCQWDRFRKRPIFPKVPASVKLR